MSEDDAYDYRSRELEDMSSRFFRLGDGRISGYLSLLLGTSSLLAVLAFRYPQFLTTADLRAVYDVDVLRVALRIGMWLALCLGGLTFVLGRRRRLGTIGVLLTLVAFGLGGYRVEVGPVAPQQFTVGVDWLVIDLLLTGLLFITLEKLIPKYPGQAVLRPEWQTDLGYFALNHLLVSLMLIAGNGFAPAVFGWAVNAKLQAFVQGLPFAAQLLLLLFCADFVQYWIHRSFHEVPALWKVHAVHHSTEHMDWLAGSRNHLLNVTVERSLVMVPLYLLGPSLEALNAYVVFAALQAVFIHANVRIPFGPLKYLLATPQFHHWHHSSEKPAIDTNYAVHLPLFDRLFGTYHMPMGLWPADYGTTKRLPRTFWAQLRYPFT